MALRVKTVEYAFDTRVASLPGGTRYDWGALTLHIPEATSRTFRSVLVIVNARTDDATATNINAATIGCKLGAAAFSDKVVARVYNQSGEHLAGEFWMDFTAYFEANFGAGISQTCQVGWMTPAVMAATINISAKVVITYEFDDAGQDTRLKTVRIPLEGFVGNLSGALTEMGTDQIPALASFLPEAGVTVRDLFLEVMFNEASTGTVDQTLGLEIDAEGETLFGTHRQNLNSSCWHLLRWKRSDLSAATAHAFKARLSAGTGFNTLGAVLVVTYEYDHATTATVLNSILIPFEMDPFHTAGNPSRWARSFFVEEPGPITLRQSGVLLYFNANAILTGLSLGVGSQTPRAYTHASGTLTCGQFTLLQRFDSGGEAGAGVSLARGLNLLQIQGYSSVGVAVGKGNNFGGLVLLNYTSGLHPEGADTHAHTTSWAVMDASAPAAATWAIESAAMAPVIPEASWYSVAVGFQGCVSTTSVTQWLFRAEVKDGEGDDAGGWRTLYSSFVLIDAERQTFNPVVRARDEFQRYPTDPEPGRLQMETPRKYLAQTPNVEQPVFGMALLLTHHAMVKAVAGTLTGFTGDGAGIEVKAYRTDTGQLIGKVITTLGGAYSVPWYDDTVPVFCTARQDGARVGRSDDGLAV